jgi:hypothetical protein
VVPAAEHRSRTAGEGDKPQDSRARHRGVGQRQGTDESFEQRRETVYPTQSEKHVSQGLMNVRKAAKGNKEMKFTALLHHLTIDLLRESFYALKRKAAPGIDGVTWQEYETGLEDRLIDLHGRVHRGAYRAQPSWPETAAGSVSTARSDKEAPRDLGDPLWSWSAHEADRVCWTIRIIPEKGRRHGAKSDSLVVLRARESCVHGEAAKQMKTDSRETSPAPTEAGN